MAGIWGVRAGLNNHQNERSSPSESLGQMAHDYARRPKKELRLFLRLGRYGNFGFGNCTRLGSCL